MRKYLLTPPENLTREWRQVRMLVRVFLASLVDLEILSTDADTTRLVGQFATIFASISFFATVPALFVGLSGQALLERTAWMPEHFFIATTIAAVGVVTVLMGDRAWPDRRDMLVLGPLPVGMRTIFAAKTAAVFATVLITIVSLHTFSGLLWPMAFRSTHGGVIGFLRTWPAYWSTMLLSGVFIFCVVLALEGLIANLLPRQLFLRVAAWMQATLVMLILATYVLEPSLESTQALTSANNHRLLYWLPDYWFLGLLQQLNGTMHPEFVPLAHRAWLGLAGAVTAASVMLVTSYISTAKKIVEQTEIQPLFRGTGHLPIPGSGLGSAIAKFSGRTILRSRQHRLLLSFYFGIGMAVTLAYARTFGRTAGSVAGVSVNTLFASILLMALAVAGVRVVSAIPIELRANWIFRVTEVQPSTQYRTAVRRTWLVLGAGAAWIVLSAAMVARYGLHPPVEWHLAALALFGSLLVEACLIGFNKVPFACSYLPGKANLHLVFWAFVGAALRLVHETAKFEATLLADRHRAICTLLALATAWGALVAVNEWVSRRGPLELRFEEDYGEEVIALKL